MNRIRMGIQSGSERLLEFYKRPTPIQRVRDATVVLNNFADYMIPPAYDIILENPIEDVEDVHATLDLLYNMPRPYTLNVFALRVIPNTIMARDLERLGYEVPPIDQNYMIGYKPTVGNALVFMLTFFKPPFFLYKFLRQRSYPVNQHQRKYPVAVEIFRILYLIKRGIDHLRFMDFSLIPGGLGLFMWRIGAIRFWRRYVLKRTDALIEEM